MPVAVAGCPGVCVCVCVCARARARFCKQSTAGNLGNKGLIESSFALLGDLFLQPFEHFSSFRASLSDERIISASLLRGKLQKAT